MTDETEAELRARLGAKDIDDPTASTHAASGETSSLAGPAAVPDRNPYLVALVSLASIFGAIAVILYIVAASDNQDGSDPVGQLTAIGAANTWISFAALMFVGAMIVGGITWRRNEREK